MDIHAFYIRVADGPSTVSLWPSKTTYTVREGGNVSTIICFAACRPACTYFWSGPNIATGTTQNLTLTRVNRNQTGTFYCTASNQIINAAETSSDIKVDVQCKIQHYVSYLITLGR